MVGTILIYIKQLLLELVWAWDITSQDVYGQNASTYIAKNEYLIIHIYIVDIINIQSEHMNVNGVC